MVSCSFLAAFWYFQFKKNNKLKDLFWMIIFLSLLIKTII
nr:MAG TPA: hypothetical protein [Caudoviricetes sp.]